jgi:predicted amidohydrolase YtcJ
VQPSFLLRRERYQLRYAHPVVTVPWAGIATGGAPLAFSSDWPCTWPADPFVAMQQAVVPQVWKSADTAPILGAYLDGAARGGAVPTGGIYTSHSAERVTVEQALAAYTCGDAYAAFSDDRVGTIEVGKKADLAVLSQDPFAVTPETLGKTCVLRDLGRRQARL